jgi:hypothetical protein
MDALILTIHIYSIYTNKNIKQTAPLKNIDEYWM